MHAQQRDGVHSSSKRIWLCRYDEVIRSKKFAHGDRVGVNNLLNSAFVGPVQYRICLGFHPETKEPEGQRPVGWGTIAVKALKGIEPTHYPFKLCHKGYYACFKKESEEEKRRNQGKSEFGSTVVSVFCVSMPLKAPCLLCVCQFELGALFFLLFPEDFGLVLNVLY